MNVCEGNTPEIRKMEIIVDWQSYLSGFVDGEGCFCVTFNRSKRHKFGWDIRPSFSASQNSDRAEVLYRMRDYFGCGTIRPDRSDRTIKYEVRSVPELIERIIPHFKDYPLFSKKQDDFEKFSEIVGKMMCKEHLTEDGFRAIAIVAEGLNASSKKRYLRSEFKV